MARLGREFRVEGWKAQANPKHTIYALSFKVKFMLYLSCEKNENKQNESGFGPILN